MCCLMASSVAMFSALVTTVTVGDGPADPRSERMARALATSVVVVPPLRPATWPGRTMLAASAPMRCFSDGCRSVL